MKKLVMGLALCSLIFASCSDDDDAAQVIVPDAGVLSGGPFTFCVDDEASTVSGITTDPNAVGTNRTFVITDDAGMILGLPPNNEALEGVNFDDAGPGVCLIWYLRYEDGIEGLDAGMNANNLSGSFDLSNSIMVTRNEPDAGTLSGGPFTFTIDGTPDNVSGITTDPNAVGTNRMFVITDEDGMILGTPPDNAALEGVDFDGAGVGVCFIYYLRSEDGLTGAEMGADIDDLEGCFSLSNSIRVDRN